MHFVKLTWQPTVVCRLSNHPTGCNLPPKVSFHQSVLRWAFQVVHWMIPRSKAHIFVWWNVWVGILLKTIMKQQSNKLFLWSWIARDAECFLGVGTAEIDGIPACNDGFRMFLLSQTAQPSCIWQAGCALRTNISKSWTWNFRKGGKYLEQIFGRLQCYLQYPTNWQIDSTSYTFVDWLLANDREAWRRPWWEIGGEFFLTQRTYTTNSIPIVMCIHLANTWLDEKSLEQPLSLPNSFSKWLTLGLLKYSMSDKRMTDLRIILFFRCTLYHLVLCSKWWKPLGSILVWQSHDADTIHWYALFVLLEMAKNPQSESEESEFCHHFFPTCEVMKTVPFSMISCLRS